MSQTPTLLLVEDDETDAMLMRRSLRKQGLTAPMRIVSDGAEALEILRSRQDGDPPFVVVTDLKMPIMSGHELIEKIRADAALKDILVFVLSSSNLPDDMRRAHQLGIAGYLIKEAEPEDLDAALAVLVEVCDRGRGTE